MVGFAKVADARKVWRRFGGRLHLVNYASDKVRQKAAVKYMGGHEHAVIFWPTRNLAHLGKSEKAKTKKGGTK